MKQLFNILLAGFALSALAGCNKKEEKKEPVKKEHMKKDKKSVKKSPAKKKSKSSKSAPKKTKKEDKGY